MERRSFLKAIGFTSAAIVSTGKLSAATLPVEEKIKVSDIFTRRNKNRRLARLTPAYQKHLVSLIREEKIPVFNAHPVYRTEFSIQLPLKQEYDAIEVRNFFEQIIDACIKRKNLYHNDYDGVMRFYFDKETSTITPDIFGQNGWHNEYYHWVHNINHKYYKRSEAIEFFPELRIK